VYDASVHEHACMSTCVCMYVCINELVSTWMYYINAYDSWMCIYVLCMYQWYRLYCIDCVLVMY